MIPISRHLDRQCRNLIEIILNDESISISDFDMKDYGNNDGTNYILYVNEEEDIIFIVTIEENDKIGSLSQKRKGKTSFHILSCINFSDSREPTHTEKAIKAITAYMDSAKKKILMNDFSKN